MSQHISKDHGKEGPREDAWLFADIVITPPSTRKASKQVNAKANTGELPVPKLKKDWVLVCTLLKLHLIKKITKPPEISLKN